MVPPALRMLVAACAVLLIAGSVHAAVYVNRDYYWDGYNQEWRYNIVDRHYNDGQTVTWNADSDFGRQGSGPEYIVEAQVFVNEGARLNIGQGVTVKFSPGKWLGVAGEMMAEGTKEKRGFGIPRPRPRPSSPPTAPNSC
ncbi:MAG: hypothetical protein KatS3mg024_1625 [Armatimonadota bacterium]|nr:MAG: hypothetical protein KatS3mg024_1625 [Armatimonadota bacterium]